MTSRPIFNIDVTYSIDMETGRKIVEVDLGGDFDPFTALGVLDCVRAQFVDAATTQETE